MKLKKKTKSPILESVYSAAKDLHDAGVLDVKTMREFDALCLPEIKMFTPTHIQRIRRAAGVSQAVFAAYLNTSPSTIRQWEQGDKSPSGPSLRLLNLIESKGLEVLT